MEKSIPVEKVLSKKMGSNNYNWFSERDTPKRSNRKYDVDEVILLAKTVDALAQIFDKYNASPTPHNVLGSL